MNFVTSRLNRNNFWNIMFWALITVFFILSEYFNNIKLIEYAFLGFAILGVPFIVTQAQGVTFLKEYGLFNSNGKSLKDSLPKHLPLVIAFAGGIVLSIVFIENALFTATTEPIAIILRWSVFLLVITLYFILINCPISILFNKNAYEPMSPEELEIRLKSPSIGLLRFNLMYITYPFNRHWKKRSHRR